MQQLGLRLMHPSLKVLLQRIELRSKLMLLLTKLPKLALGPGFTIAQSCHPLEDLHASPRSSQVLFSQEN
jgi:hypothetical protein